MSVEGRPTLAEIVAAVLLPPLAVFLRRGLGMEFWIATALTLIWWVPGVIYAFVVLYRPNLISRRA
ncbi:YqaE/Pmp3 family membrane protein [uncultured Sphingomonas sp.]|uniref:YqaE/Pmp3 family membrane protein n=1 Tax=uncultured Sphingomonas sp. TaxID=158754 RepID=UPI0025CD3435|nr:YqaE/Pmp3 family membrane protein [uncultured Sphingomonas sp.]